MSIARAALVPGTAAILAIAGGVAPPLAVFAPLGLAPLLALTAVALLATNAQRTASGIAGLAPLAVLLAALGLWAAASASWSILPGHSLFEGLRFLTIGAAGLVAMGAARALAPEEQIPVARAILAGVSLAILLLLIAIATNGAPSRWYLGISSDTFLNLARYDRGATTLVMALWPALLAAALRRRRALIVALAIAVPAATFVSSSDTAKLAIVAGFVVFGAAYIAPRFVAGAMALGLLVFAVAMPLETPAFPTVLRLQHELPWIKYSVLHRMVIWRFSADRIAERPLLGWGMDSARDMPGGGGALRGALPDGRPIGFQFLPLHPHDAALELRLELGFPGLLLGLAIAGWCLWRVGFAGGLARGYRAAALAWGASALLFGLLSFSLWQAWWQSCLWLTASLLAATTARKG